MEESLELRMYHLVLYNLSPIQQGIQAYHAGMKYSRKHKDSSQLIKWADHDQTVIILSVGGSIEMEDAIVELNDNDITYSRFNEVDLYGRTTAVAFLADERVWDRKKYYDLEQHEPYILAQKAGREDVVNSITTAYIEAIGGHKNYFLRNFIRQYRLA